MYISYNAYLLIVLN